VKGKVNCFKIENGRGKMIVPDEGPAKGAVVSNEEFQVGLDDYYEARGWTMDGIPTGEKLNELNLSEYASIVQGGKA